MHRFKVMLALLLLACCGVPLAGAAGVGTFSIEQTTAGVGVGQFGIATLYMDNTWQPPADSATLAITWDPGVIQYVSTDWKVGNSVAATPAGNSELTLSFADYTNKYPTGRVAIAAINFKGVKAGQATVGIRVDSVRSHVGISETDFTELTPSSIATPGIFAVGAGGGIVTTITTVPVGPTGTVPLPVTTSPGVTVTGNVTGAITTPITIATLVPTTGPTGITTGVPTGITTGVPFVPVQGSTGGGGGSEDYTGSVTRTATVSPTRTATGTVTATVTATPTVTTGAGNGTVTMTTATPAMNMTTGTASATATRTALATMPAGTTARTTVPVNTTATRAGLDALPLAVAGLAALALIAARRR